MMFVTMIVFALVLICIALMNKKNETVAVEENTVALETSTNWDLLLAKIEQDNADILAQEELAEIVGTLTEEITIALDARKYDGIEAMEEIKASFSEFLYSELFEAMASQKTDFVGKDIEGIWLHTMPEQYLPSFSSYQREVCVSSVENGVTFGSERPVLVLKGTCRYLFSADANSLLTPDENGRLDRRSWAQPTSLNGAHDEGWLWCPTSDLLEILVPNKDMKIRVEGLGFNCPVSVIPNDASRQEFIWDRYQVPAAQRGVTPSNVETKEIK